jgi:hypothetical protein
MTRTDRQRLERLETAAGIAAVDIAALPVVNFSGDELPRGLDKQR